MYAEDQAPPAAPAELPMPCRRAGVLIEKELAGALGPAEREELERHLGQCPDCRRYREEAAALCALFRGIRLRFPGAPEAVAVPVRRRLYLPLVGAVAALFLAAVGLSVYLLRGEGAAGPAAAGAPRTIAERLGLGLAVRREAVSGPVGRAAGGPAVERIPRPGLLVVEVAAGSWAERVGIRPGDRLMSAAGVSLAGREGYWALGYMLRQLPPGEVLPVVVLREGRLFRVEYRSGER